MHFYELLAQDDGFPIQGIIFLIVAIFSFLKWLYENIVGKKQQDSNESDALEDLYEQYRDEIRQRQTQITPPEIFEPQAPPPLPHAVEKESAPLTEPEVYQEAPEPRFSQEDIERLRAKKANSAYAINDTPQVQRTDKRGSQSLRAELMKKGSLRKAILLREIIGPPKALSND